MKEIQKFNNEQYTISKIKLDKGTFLAKDWVQPKDVITYRYLDDPKFYREDELPENKGRLGNVIVKVPSSMTKEEAFSQLGLETSNH